MAKSLSEKSKAIRVAIGANPTLGNTELADKLNDSADRLDDKFTFTAQDVGNQRSAMKKPGAVQVEAAPEAVPDPAAPPPATTRNGRPRKKPGRKPGSKKAAASVTKAPKQAGVVEVIDDVFALAEKVGGIGQLQRLVERLAGR